MAMLGRVKRGLLSFLSKVPPVAYAATKVQSLVPSVDAASRIQFLLPSVNAATGLQSLFQPLNAETWPQSPALYKENVINEAVILIMMSHESSMFADLKSVREELQCMVSCARTRHILLITEFGEKKPLSCLKLDQGIEIRQDAIETLTSKFDNLSMEEGKLLRKLSIINQAIQERLSKWSTQRTNDSKLTHKVKQVLQERIIACFETMREATQYFELLYYLHQDCHFITQNCSSEEILKTCGKELKWKFPFLNDALLKHGMDDHISRLQRMYEAKLTYEFCLLLPSCKFIEHIPEALDADIESVKHVKEFQGKFIDLPKYNIEEGLNIYKQLLEGKSDTDEDKWRSAYEEEVEGCFNRKKKAFLKVSSPFRDPLYNMVLYSFKQGHVMDMDGDPKTEVWKVKNHYENFYWEHFTAEQRDQHFDPYFMQFEYDIFDHLFLPYVYEG